VALIAAGSIAQAAKNEAAFEFAQGVIVDPAAAAVYVMSPEGGIDAVSVSGGAVLARTAQGAKPLLLYDGSLLAQAERKDGSNTLSLAGLSTKDLKPLFLVDVPLPSGIAASVNDRLGATFYAGARRMAKRSLWRGDPSGTG
jgi:hypothetical protein